MVSTIFYPDRDGTLNLERLPCAALRSCYCKKEIQSVVDMLWVRFSYGTGCALAKTRLIPSHHRRLGDACGSALHSAAFAVCFAAVATGVTVHSAAACSRSTGQVPSSVGLSFLISNATFDLPSSRCR